MRRQALYWLIAVNLILIAANVIAANVLRHIRNDVRQGAISVNVGCGRSNVQRDAVRFLLLARVHDSKLVGDTATNEALADYFKDQAKVAEQKLEALVAASTKTFPDPKDPFLVDCDKSYPLP